MNPSADCPTIKKTAILAAILGGCNTHRRLRHHFRDDEKNIRNAVFTLRRAGLLKPFKGGREFKLEASEEGVRIITGLIHGIRALTVKKVEGAEEKA